jgi:hypothetical protein
MDGVSAVASFASLLEFLYKVTGWAIDTIKAKKERQKLLDGLDRLRSTIKSIDERRKDAKPGDEWYDGLLELVRTSGTLSPEGKYEPNPKHGSETSLSKLYMLLEGLNEELSPAEGLKKYKQRLRYHWDKVKYEQLLKEFARCREEISFILDEDHFKISRAIRQDGKETLHEVSEIRSRMSTLEDYQKRQEERVVKQKDEADREAVEKWLSPLEFLARQEELYEQAFGTGKWFLESLAFRHWVKGKPWHLRCYGVEGSGKVRLANELSWDEH